MRRVDQQLARKTEQAGVARVVLDRSRVAVGRGYAVERARQASEATRQHEFAPRGEQGLARMTAAEVAREIDRTEGEPRRRAGGVAGRRDASCTLYQRHDGDAGHARGFGDVRGGFSLGQDDPGEREGSDGRHVVGMPGRSDRIDANKDRTDRATDDVARSRERGPGSTLRSGETASSRSRMTASAPDAKALRKRSGRSAGTNSGSAIESSVELMRLLPCRFVPPVGTFCQYHCAGGLIAPGYD